MCGHLVCGQYLCLTSTNYFSTSAINSIAEYALHEHSSNRWNSARDYEHFIWLCNCCIGVVVHIEGNKFDSSDASNHLYHFKKLLNTSHQLVCSPSTPVPLSGYTVSCLCVDMYDLVTTHPSLKPDLVECVKALSTIRAHLDPVAICIDCKSAINPVEAVDKLYAMYNIAPTIPSADAEQPPAQSDSPQLTGP